MDATSKHAELLHRCCAQSCFTVGPLSGTSEFQNTAFSIVRTRCSVMRSGGARARQNAAFCPL
eukprot:14774903-Alexandrium_andersonii.AAC.1